MATGVETTRANVLIVVVVVLYFYRLKLSNNQDIFFFFSRGVIYNGKESFNIEPERNYTVSNKGVVS